MKKKFFAAALAIALILIFGACGGADPAAGQGEQLPNPVVEVEGSAAFSALGCFITVPSGATDARYAIIADEIAQIQFTLERRAYTYRAANTAEDISGVYETFDAAETVSLGDASARVETIGGGANGALAAWSAGETRYTLYTPDATDASTIGALALTLIEADAASGQ